MINGVDLSDLRQTVVSKTMDQVFKSSVSFQEGLDVRDVTIGSTLNGQMIGKNNNLP